MGFGTQRSFSVKFSYFFFLQFVLVCVRFVSDCKFKTINTIGMQRIKRNASKVHSELHGQMAWSKYDTFTQYLYKTSSDLSHYCKLSHFKATNETMQRQSFQHIPRSGKFFFMRKTIIAIQLRPCLWCSGNTCAVVHHTHQIRLPVSMSCANIYSISSFQFQQWLHGTAECATAFLSHVSRRRRIIINFGLKNSLQLFQFIVLVVFRAI